MCGGGGDSAARYARQQQQQQEARITEGMHIIESRFAPFNEDFYGQRAQDYMRYAMPQFGQQYMNTRNQMLFNMANRGLLDSSAMRGMANRFSLEANTQKQGLVDAGINQANDLRSRVEQARMNLTNQLGSTGNIAGVRTSAANLASSFGAPSTFAPIGDLFQNFATWNLAKQMNRAYAPVTQYAMSQSTGFAPKTANYNDE